MLVYYSLDPHRYIALEFSHYRVSLLHFLWNWTINGLCFYHLLFETLLQDFNLLTNDIKIGQSFFEFLFEFISILFTFFLWFVHPFYHINFHSIDLFPYFSELRLSFPSFPINILINRLHLCSQLCFHFSTVGLNFLNDPGMLLQYFFTVNYFFFNLLKESLYIVHGLPNTVISFISFSLFTLFI